MKTLVGTPDPEDRDLEREFRQLDLKLAEVRAVMEQARSLSSRKFDLN